MESLWCSYNAEFNHENASNSFLLLTPITVVCVLRSKDIEASGFNGTAVFKEVRVQSIVVEFILTHVPQLFPEQGSTTWAEKIRNEQPFDSNLYAAWNLSAVPSLWLLTSYANVQVDHRREGSLSPPNQQSPIRTEILSSSLVLRRSLILATSALQMLLYPSDHTMQSSKALTSESIHFGFS